jgi:hypothetical protein
MITINKLEDKKMRLLTVFNICHKDKENCDHYINSINSIFNQDLGLKGDKIENKVVISALRNTESCLRRMRETFRNNIDIVYYGELWTVNITFNKTIQEVVKRFGNFDGYIYIDSGVALTDPNAIKTMANLLDSGLYSMITIQTDTDNGLSAWLGLDLVRNQDFIMPVGRACNLHCQLFSSDIFETYGKRIMPDVFAAYCTESVFSFLNSAIHKRWVIAKDIIVHHSHGLDGGSMYFEKISPKFGTPWNNLLFGRNAFDFMNDPEAIDAGLGYEEIFSVMVHKGDMHENDVHSRAPERLKAVILKYLFSNNNELNYDNITHTYNAY